MENSAMDYREVYQRIAYYKNNSYDQSFHNYLDSVLQGVSTSGKTPQQLCAELDANYKKYLQIMNDMNKDKAVKNRNKLEYNIGVGALSAFGAAFVLFALFSLFKEYIHGIVFSIILFAVGAIVTLISELLINRKNLKAGHCISGLGMAILYFAASFSYVSLKVYNEWILAIIVLLITAVAFLLYRKNKSQIMEMVMGIGVNAVALTVSFSMTDVKFVLFAVIIIACNLLVTFLHCEETFVAAWIVRLCSMIISAVVLCTNANGGETNKLLIVCVALGYVLVFMLSYCKNVTSAVIKVFAAIGIVTTLLQIVSRSYNNLWCLIATAVGLLAICFISYLMLKNTSEKFVPYIVTMAFLAVRFLAFEDETVILIALLSLLLISKAMLYTNDKAVELFDCVMTAIALFATLVMYNNPIVYAIYIVALLGCLIAKDLKLVHIIITSIVLVFFSFLNGFLWVSVSLMLVALMLIVWGCIINKFEVRICGLVLSLFVCVKVALYDFREAEDVRRLIVFLIVGLLAIAIAIAYMFLERHEAKEKEALNLSFGGPAGSERANDGMAEAATNVPVESKQVEESAEDSDEEATDDSVTAEGNSEEATGDSYTDKGNDEEIADNSSASEAVSDENISEDIINKDTDNSDQQ